MEKQYKILVAADFSYNNTPSMVSDFLERRGFCISKANEKTEAMALLEKTADSDLPNCIVTNLADMLKIKKNGRLADIIIFYLFNDQDFNPIEDSRVKYYLERGFDNILYFNIKNTIIGGLSRLDLLTKIKLMAELNSLRRQVKLLE